MKHVKKLLIILLYIGLILINTKAYAKTGITTSETTRIRKEANTDSDIVTLLSPDAEVEILEEEGEWYKVSYKKYTGYIRKDLLSIKEDTSNQNATNTSNENTNSQLQENNSTLEESNNTTVPATDTSYENSSNETSNSTENENTLDSSNDTENIEQNNLNTTETQNTEVDTLQKGYTGRITMPVILKILPSINSSEIITINENAEITILDVINKWCYIESGTDTGWVLLSKIKTEGNIETNTPSGENETLPEQTKDESENETDKNETSKEDESKEETKIVTKYVSTETLNLRKKPDNNAEIVDQITLNTAVTVDEVIDSTWSKITIKGKTGYVASKYLSDNKVDASSRGENLTREVSNYISEETEPKQETVDIPESKPVETSTSSSSLGSEIAEYAKQFLGCNYVSGGSSPSTGFDCSGFTCYVYNHFGFSLNRTSSAQNSNGTAVSKQDLKEGDLLIFNNSSNSSIRSCWNLYWG